MLAGVEALEDEDKNDADEEDTEDEDVADDEDKELAAEVDDVFVEGSIQTSKKKEVE